MVPSEAPACGDGSVPAMRRVLLFLALLVVVASCDREPVVLEPEEIDVCPVVAGQLEGLLETIVDFVESASLDELTASGGTADELARRGAELSQRATDLGCDPQEVRSLISTADLDSEDPLGALFIERVLDALE